MEEKKRKNEWKGSTRGGGDGGKEYGIDNFRFINISITCKRKKRVKQETGKLMKNLRFLFCESCYIVKALFD